jgi:hypothetical protein
MNRDVYIQLYYLMSALQPLKYTLQHALLESPPHKLFKERLVVKPPLHIVGLFGAHISFLPRDKEDQAKNQKNKNNSRSP